MRSALIACVALAASCRGAHPASHVAAPPIAPGFPATQWVPAHPTYVLASPTVRDAQRALTDVVDSLGVPLGIDASVLSRELALWIAVDPLSPEALTAIGIDLQGGFVAFSEDVSPTFVVHLSAPEAVAAFFDRQRERGLVTQSVVVEGTEIFTAQLLGAAGLKVSWAVAADWLWVHFAVPVGRDEGTTWFTASRHPDGPAWASAWRFASAAFSERPGLLGFIDAREVIETITRKVPEAFACAKLLDPVRQVGVAVSGSGKHAAGKLTLDLGAASSSIERALLPAPAGFTALAAGAPLAVQWNLDLFALRAWLAPCLLAAGENAEALDGYGVRSLRAVLRTFDPADRSGTGAVGFDLVHDRYFAARLDEIPFRSTLERSRTFGPHAGHRLTVPMIATLDYVLTAQLALAGIGDGLLGTLVGTGAVTRGPLAAIDIAPPALGPDAWTALVRLIGVRGAEDVVEQLLRWRDGHIAITIEGTSLVVAAAGNRR